MKKTIYSICHSKHAVYQWVCALNRQIAKDADVEKGHASIEALRGESHAREQSKESKAQLHNQILTCPCLSISLLVNLTFSKETTCFLNWSPVYGASGWIHRRFGEGGSALPATSQEDRWYAYLYLLLSTGTMSMRTMYLFKGSTPVNEILSVGNIRLHKWFVCFNY